MTMKQNLRGGETIRCPHCTGVIVLAVGKNRSLTVTKGTAPAKTKRPRDASEPTTVFDILRGASEPDDEFDDEPEDEDEDEDEDAENES